MRLDRSSSGKTVDMAVGEAVDLYLPETPTAGFRWHMVSASDALLTIEQDEFMMPENSPKMALGGSGTRHLSLRAGKAGEAALELHYRRSWEKNVAPENKFSIRIRIAGG